MEPIRDFAVPVGVDRVEAVFVNGVRQVEGRDYHVAGRRVSFARPLDRVRRLSLVQKLLIAFCANVDEEGDEVDAIVVAGTERRSVSLPAADGDAPQLLVVCHGFGFRIGECCAGAFNLGDDVFGAGGPGERCRVGVPVRGPDGDCVGEVLHAHEAAAA